MNSKERDDLLSRLDERSEETQKKLDSLNAYCMALDERTQSNTSAIEKTKWHDWAIKGSIASIVGLFFASLFELMK